MLSDLRKTVASMNYGASFPLSGSVELAPDELRDAASMTPLEVDVLSAQGGPSRIRKVRSRGGWAFDTSFMNGHVRARGAFEKRHVVVLSVMRGGDSAICGVPLEDGVLLMLPDGEEIAATIRPGVVFSAAVLPSETWNGLAAVEFDDPAAAFRTPRAVRLASRSASALGAELVSALRHLDGDGEAPLDIPSPVLDYLGSVSAAFAGSRQLARDLDNSWRRRLSQAWQAADFIHANLEHPLSVTRLCREVGVSRRQLEYAFQTAFSVGPSEYVRLTRLNEARRRLRLARAAGRTVTEVAYDTGVTHLGRFASSYRLLFGETPLQTLRGTR